MPTSSAIPCITSVSATARIPPTQEYASITTTKPTTPTW